MIIGFNGFCDGGGVALHKYGVCLKTVLNHIRVVKPKSLDQEGLKLNYN